jgi:hypothetical protein
MVPTNPPLITTDKNDDKYRTSTWCFGGIVFPEAKEVDQREVTEGYTFFQKSHIVSLHCLTAGEKTRSFQLAIFL